MNPLPLPKKKFGRLTPIALFKATGEKFSILCVCDCGTVGNYERRKLGNRIKSCGCKRSSTHGLMKVNGKRRSEYRSWDGMKSRCYVKTSYKYPNWGGRGIGVCKRWRNSFANFFKDMGPKPSPEHSLDRINNDGNYEPGNCRWATKREQALNQRRPTNPTAESVLAGLAC
jgi:hypothetical protein